MDFLLRLRHSNSLDDILRLKYFPRKDIDQLYLTLIKHIKTNKVNSRESIDALRQIIQILTLCYEETKLNAELEQLCLNVLLSENSYTINKRIRLLCLLICLKIRNASKEGTLYSKLSHNDNDGSFAGYDKDRLAFLIPMLITMGSSEHFEKNLGHLVTWMQSFSPLFSSSSSGFSFEEPQQQRSSSEASPNRLSRASSMSAMSTSSSGSPSDAIQGLRPSLWSAVAKIASYDSDIFDYEQHVLPLERMFCNWLLKAENESDKGQKKLFRTATMLSVPVTELDGTPISDFFTVFNTATSQFSQSQISNVYTFSILKTWIRYIYINNLVERPLAFNEQEAPQQTEKEKLIQKFNTSDALLESVIAYCTRVINQAELQFKDFSTASAPKSVASFPYTFVEATLVECVQTLDSICTIHPHLVSRVFPILKKLFQRLSSMNKREFAHKVMVDQMLPGSSASAGGGGGGAVTMNTINMNNLAIYFEDDYNAPLATPYTHKYTAPMLSPSDSTPVTPMHLGAGGDASILAITKYSGVLFLHLLEFFMNHTHTMVFDSHALFSDFFFYNFCIYYKNSFFALETMILLLRSKDYFSSHFDEHYPAIFKLLSHLPHVVINEFDALLQYLSSTSYFVDIFHRILDLPLLAFILEAGPNVQTLIKNNSAGPRDTTFLSILFESILSDEVNSEAKFWAAVGDQQEAIFNTFCECIQSNVSPRVMTVAKYTIPLLETYFRVLDSSNTTHLQTIIPIIFKRINTVLRIAAVPEFAERVSQVLIQGVVSIFKKHPTLIVDLQSLIFNQLQRIDHASTLSPAIYGNHIEKKKENHYVVITHLCYIIGECAGSISPSSGGGEDDQSRVITADLLQQYYNAIEIMTYVQLNALKKQFQKTNQLSTLLQHQSTARSGFLSATTAIATSSSLVLKQQSINETRMFHALVGAMSKLGARCPDLLPKIIICLANIVKHRECFNPSVISRVNEVIRLFKSTSLASSILCPDIAHSSNTDDDHHDHNHDHDHNNINNNSETMVSASSTNHRQRSLYDDDEYRLALMDDKSSLTYMLQIPYANGDCIEGGRLYSYGAGGAGAANSAATSPTTTSPSPAQ